MNNYNIEPVAEHNWRDICDLKVSNNQTNFIESNAESLLEAAYDKRHDWKPYALYHHDTLIGFAMVGAYHVQEKYIWLDRFMIDQRFQGKGYSKPLLKIVVAMIIEKWKPNSIVLSLDLENKRAQTLYEKIGFKLIGMTDPNNGEQLMAFTIES